MFLFWLYIYVLIYFFLHNSHAAQFILFLFFDLYAYVKFLYSSHSKTSQPIDTSQNNKDAKVDSLRV